MIRRLVRMFAIGGSLLATATVGLGQKASQNEKVDLGKVYRDESHCLTIADMRGDRDMPISCFCRDAIVDVRYVHFRYLNYLVLAPTNDSNLVGILVTLVRNIHQQCGENYDAYAVATNDGWKWNGPEVVRTYPSDEVISRIPLERGVSGVPTRWVPFTCNWSTVILEAVSHGRKTTQAENSNPWSK